MDSFADKLIFYMPILAIIVGILSVAFSVFGISRLKNKLKNRNAEYQKMNSDFDDLKNRVQKELKKN